MSNIMKKVPVIPLVISLILLGLLLPIGINTIYGNTIYKTETTSMNSTSRTNMVLNATHAGLYNGSLLIPTYTNYTDVNYNCSLTHSVNFTLSFQIVNTNASANTVYKCDLVINGGAQTVAFNASNALNTSFAFNTVFVYEDIIPSVTNITVRMYSIITSNNTISSIASIVEEYTDSTTDTINSLYLIVPLMAVVGIVISFTKFKNM